MVPASDASAIIQVIERAARDPSVDIERMERLLAMHERLVAGQSKTAYMAALSRLQPKLPIVQERGSILNKAGGVQSRYAFWEDIIGIITPILASEGFSLSFRIGNANERVQVTGVLAHAQGHSEETPIDLPADISGNKNAVQAVASSVSYGKRYTAGALLNLRTGEIDDDGQGASDKTGDKKDAPNPKEYSKRFLEALDLGLDQAIIDIHNEIVGDADFYREAWHSMPAPARRAIKEIIARSKPEPGANG